MKRTIYTIILFLLIGIGTVNANTNISINVVTPDDVDMVTNIEANGSVRFNLNGIGLHTIYERTKRNIIFYINEGIEWLNGKTHTEPESKAIGYALGRHFVSVGSFAHFIDDVRIAITDITNKLQILSLRLEAVEQTLNEIAPNAYCRNKVKTMLKYNTTLISSVKCDNTMFYKKQYGVAVISTPELKEIPRNTRTVVLEWDYTINTHGIEQVMDTQNIHTSPYFNIYRNGKVIKKITDARRFEDKSVVSGETYTYMISAVVDDIEIFSNEEITTII